MAAESAPDRSLRAFSLVELLVSAAIVAVLLVLMISVLVQATSLWRRSSETVEAFQSARLAFDLLTRNLGQATLNAYLDYDSATAPTRYLRRSELACRIGPAGVDGLPGTAGAGQAVFFQAPLGFAAEASHAGLEGLLSACGYFVSFTTNSALPAHVDSGGQSARFRLMQALTPAEDNRIYQAAGSAWIPAEAASAAPVADNVITLVLRPQDPAVDPADLTADYRYDTRKNAGADPQPDEAHQLPPVIQVTMVAIAEEAAARTDPAVIVGALAGKFREPSAFASDLKDLETRLAAARIPYRVFSSAVPIRESKWTK